jgi:GT2 family glycosyltransferase
MQGLSTIELTEHGAPQLIDVRPGTDRMIAETDDPQMVFKPADPIAAGWYVVTAEIVARGVVEPQIYFDLGSGFIETFSARLIEQRKGSGRFSVRLKLPAPALLVRLDPLSQRGDFTLNSLCFKPLSKARIGLGLAGHGLTMLRTDPARFVSRLPVYLGQLNQPRFFRLGHVGAGKGGRNAYARWIDTHDYNDLRDREGLTQAAAELGDAPLISVVMPVYNTPRRLLVAAIDSVRAQIYQNWQLCIADDASTLPHVRQILSAYAARDKRIVWTQRPINGHISHATNSAMEMAEGAWIALLDHDDILRENALAEVALEIARHPDAQLIYSDEDKLDGRGKRYDPYFKPDYSRELFRSQNYFNHLTVHRADNIRRVGGWRPGFEGSQDYDLNLRIVETIDPATIRHIPKVLYHWRAAAGSTAAAGDAKSYAYTAGLKALEEHVARMKLPARVEAAPDTPFYRLRFAVPEPMPLVSLIIPTRDKVELLRNCIGSIRDKTEYERYEIIVVDNGSSEPETLRYLEILRTTPDTRVLEWSAPFNYSAINNFAVAEARGEIVGLINNDIEVITPGWLTEMVSWACQADVGCVGAKLYYANDTIQHAGVILGIGGVAGHSHKYFRRDSHGYFGRLKLAQNLSAVTAACLLVRKAIYEEVGGLDADNLKVAFNDVDFCLKVREAGYLNVWTPFAELYHLESVSRGSDDHPEKRERFARETLYMQRKWRPLDDPFYSPNLSSHVEDFSLIR